MTNNVLVYVAHPALEQSTNNQQLLAVANSVSGVTVVDLYAEYPDFQVDVQREQARLLAHDTVVFQFPLYWYSTPALLKQWQDSVLSYGFAYGSSGNKLNGKRFKAVTTVGGPEEAYQAGGYNHFTLSELLRPLQQMCNLAGMQYQSPMALHGVLRIGEQERTAFSEQYRAYLEQQVQAQSQAA